MKLRKTQYLLFAFLTICFGLLSRKIASIPLVVGDILYAVMIYWISRFLFTSKSLLFSCYLTITCCFTIEFLQLVQHPLFVWIRNNPLLRLVFGQGFLWSDLIAYCIGAIVASVLDYYKHSKVNH
ncbi:DUF2809 domain-containing protein [Sphingobacterium sp.]|uniref:ribosomal maturation YjgA family protein n=1 Tax=Sphingobacterium sp. TaxID=341027 RepID=UPI0038B54A0C